MITQQPQHLLDPSWLRSLALQKPLGFAVEARQMLPEDNATQLLVDTVHPIGRFCATGRFRQAHLNPVCCMRAAVPLSVVISSKTKDLAVVYM